MKWCVYYNSGKRVSEIIKCNEERLDKTIFAPSMSVQVSDDPEMLKRNPFFNTPQKQKEEEQKLLNQEVIDLLKEYQREKRWLKLQQTVKEHTGQTLCCQGAIDAFMASI